MIIFNSGLTFESDTPIESSERKNGRIREHFVVTVVGDYETVKNIFTSGEDYVVRETQINDETGEEVLVDWDKSAFDQCASIRDNMDGTFTVDMYQLSSDEKIAQSIAVYAPDNVAAAHPELYKPWKANKDYKTGDRHSSAGKVYKCTQDHTSQAQYPPELLPAYWTPLDVEHAGTSEDPIHASRGMEYKEGFYYYDSEDGKVYICTRSETLHYMPHELIGHYFEVAA